MKKIKRVMQLTTSAIENILFLRLFINEIIIISN
jgi:hypothetical protein